MGCRQALHSDWAVCGGLRGIAPKRGRVVRHLNATRRIKNAVGTPVCGGGLTELPGCGSFRVDVRVADEGGQAEDEACCAATASRSEGV